MNLINNFNDKLNSIESYKERALEAFLKLKKLLKDFVAQESLDQDIIRVFALKQNELPKIKSRLDTLTAAFFTFQKHKDIICTKEEKITKGLTLMEKLEMVQIL